MSVTSEPISESFCGFGLIVHVLEPVVHVWQKYRQLGKRAPEACGVLVGSVDADLARIWIEQATEPLKKDEVTRSGFKLIDPEHQIIVNRAFSLSNGLLSYLGTWHTHPEKRPSPSKIDLQDWNQCVKRNRDRLRFIFAIIGQSENSMYFPYYATFECLEKRKLSVKK